jgi:hypothetical protein
VSTTKYTGEKTEWVVVAAAEAVDVHHRVYKSPPILPALRQIKKV